MLIQEIADVCGIPIVEALVSHYGGRRITIPKRKPIDRLAVMGLDEELLRREFGGVAIRVPRRVPLTRSAVGVFISEGRSISTLADEYQVSTRTVMRRLKP